MYNNADTECRTQNAEKMHLQCRKFAFTVQEKKPQSAAFVTMEFDKAILWVQLHFRHCLQ